MFILINLRHHVLFIEIERKSHYTIRITDTYPVASKHEFFVKIELRTKNSIL